MPIQVYSEIAPSSPCAAAPARPGAGASGPRFPGAVFDDIPYLKGAQAERRPLPRCSGTTVWKWCTLSKLTAEALSQDKALKEAFIRDFTQKSGSVAHRYERGFRHTWAPSKTYTKWSCRPWPAFPSLTWLWTMRNP